MNIWENKSLKSMRNEKWLPIQGYENLYIVSNMGRVMSLGNGLRSKLHAYKTGLKIPTWLGVKGIDNPNSIPINQLDMNGIYIRRFASSAEAERETGIFHSEITSVCKKKRKYAHGFKWEYAK